MADTAILHVHNTDGLARVEVGAHSFMCIGALPPFDHPHVFLTFGDEHEKVCPYCSTLYVHNASLGAHAAAPASSVWTHQAASAKRA
jgi:uncharacterized Zn-finger protein